MDQQMLYQALADPTRRKVLQLLGDGDRSAGEIAQQFEMTWPSVSRHLGVLKSAGLVQSKKAGQNVAYSLEPGALDAVASEVARLARREASEQERDERYVLFERFNEVARRVIAYAQEETRDLGHPDVLPAHLVLGLLDVDEGVAAQSLRGFGVSPEAFREHVRPRYPHRENTHDLPPLSPSVRAVMESALVEAGRLNHTYVGSGVMLLALLNVFELQAEPDDAWRILQGDFRLDLDKTRQDLMNRMRGYAETARPVGMFERFTDRARQVVVHAQEEARLLKHNYIGTEHVLLGLIHEGGGLAATTLRAHGLFLENTRRSVREKTGAGTETPQGHIPFTPRAKKVLELALREALQLGHNYISTEHILLGLLREGEGVGALVVNELSGSDPSVVRKSVLERMRGPEEPEAPGAERSADEGIETIRLTLLRAVESISDRLSAIEERLKGTDDQA